MSSIPNLERRRIQGEIVKPIYEALVLEIGKDAAQALIARAVRTSVRQEARKAAVAQQAEGGPGNASMEAFARNFHKTYVEQGNKAGLDVEVLRSDATRLDFNVHRCRFLEVYEELGLGEIASVLSCNRDGAFASDFDPNIQLDRERTIAQGDACCTFRYSYRKPAGRSD